jgi:hypothetical protein
MMGLRTRAGFAAAAVAAGLLTVREAAAQSWFGFQAPHAVRAPTAALDPALAASLDAEARAAKVAEADGLVAFALRATARELRFGLSHQTRLSFDGVEREGNCVEYAELFAAIVNREHRSDDVRAWVVRSDARVLGRRVDDPAWKDHDWALVVVRTPAGPRRLYVDPTLYDMGLGWDISSAVTGDVRVP